MIKTAPFTFSEGGHQGIIESIPLFIFGIDNAENLTNTELHEHGGALLSGADDTYIIGPHAIAFRCVKKHKERVATSGLNLQLKKAKCYIKDEYNTVPYHAARDKIQEGFVFTGLGRKVYGFNCYGVPIGSSPYVKEILHQRADRIIKTVSDTGTTMNPTQFLNPEIPGGQWLC